MIKKNRLFIISCCALIFIHIFYFIYGFLKYKDVGALRPIFELYRFKFYDDVSISHFFVTSLFWVTLGIFTLKREKKKWKTTAGMLSLSKIAILVVLSCSFFISYSIGARMNIVYQLPDKQFNKDKELINLMAPFLYEKTPDRDTYYELFSRTQMLYPYPFPVTQTEKNVSYGGEKTYKESVYYHIDTLTLSIEQLPDEYYTKKQIEKKFKIKAFSDVNLSKVNREKDSIKIAYRGRKVSLPYLINPLTAYSTLLVSKRGVDSLSQRFEAARERYNLIKTYEKDSLVLRFKQLDTLLTRYHIDHNLNPAQLAINIHEEKRGYTGQRFPLFSVETNFLIRKIEMFDRILYAPVYLHSSIRHYYLAIVIGLTIFVFLISILFKRYI